MRKIACFAGIAGLALLALAQTSGKDWLNGFVKSLNTAETLSANYTVQQLGNGAAQPYRIDLAKPNKVRLDRPNELIVADGKTIVTYDKARKVYFKKPQTDAELAKMFTASDASLWSSFFKGDTYAKAGAAKVLGAKNRKGMTLTAVEVPLDAAGKTVTTFYFDNQKLARQAEILLNDPNGKVTFIFDAKDITIGAGATDDSTAENTFAFVPPAGSREMTEAEMSADRWYENLEEAKKAAAATGRLVMVDFNATWCGPCQMLKKEVFTTAEFKARGKYFVFCAIDTDQQPALAQQFGANAIPDIRFLKADGTEVHKVVGYGGKAAFLAEMDKARAAGGL